MQLILWLMSMLPTQLAVKESDFRTAEQTPFCQRMAKQETGLRLLRSAVRDSKLLLELEHGVIGAITLSDSVLRVFMDEPGRDRFHYDAFPVEQGKLIDWQGSGDYRVGEYRVLVEDYQVQIFYGDRLVWTLSDIFFETDSMVKAGLLTPPIVAAADDDADEEEEEETVATGEYPWSYTFNGHTDRVPKGPTAIRMTVTLHGCEHVYGLPERATSFQLPDAKYRLYNLDVFEYAEDSPLGLYGTVPMLMAPKREATLALLWNNPSETWVDMKSEGQDKKVLARNQLNL